MSSGGVIIVTGGIHAGASVLLADGHETVIGSEAPADFVLVDEGVAARHASVSVRGGLLRLSAHADGVRVFGHALAPGRTTVLRPGASFALGAARIQFSGHDLLTPDAVRAAELAWLLAHAPLAYVAKRWAMVSRGAKLALAVALASAGAGALWYALVPQGAVRTAPKLDGPFRHVSVRTDPKTHALIYEGYVATPADLASLAASVRRDTCASALRVVVVAQMQEQLADFLARYYRGARIAAGEPGRFRVVAPADDGYLLPESWDYARIARMARESVNGLLELAFDGHVTDGGPVRMPLRAIGMNLVRSAHGAWLADARGVRYFPGARLPLGRIERIAGCTVTVVRDDDGTHYLLSARGAYGGPPCD